jgi:DNA gyrase subunit B
MKKTDKAADYNSSHITTHSGLDGIRVNPSMYLGSTGVDGVYKSLGELTDNGVDEYLAGRNKAIRVHIDADGSYWVLDQGNGIPQGTKEVHMHVNGKDIVNKLPTMQAVFGELHTSGKYRSDAYKTSIGTHGIGSKGTNATAEYFDVNTFYKNEWYSIGFKRGKLTSKVQKLKKAPKGPDGSLKSGTCIHFKPDAKIFSVTSFPTSMLVEWAKVTSYLNPGLAIVLSGNLKGQKTKGGRLVFLSKKGPIEYVEKRIAELKTEMIGKGKVFEYKSDLADVVVAFTIHDSADIRGFTNGLSNKEGGTHVTSIVDALYDGLCIALKAAGKEKLVFAKPKKGEKGKRTVFKTADFKEGLVGLINAKLHKAEFSSQDKGKLTDARMAKDFLALATKAATEFFAKNPKLAATLAERAAKLAALKFNFANSKKLVASLNQLKRKGMPTKFMPALSDTKVKDRELFIVEGDSAGGPAKQARFPWQAVLPIKGKISNVIKMKGDKGLDSEDILHILAASGFDPKAADPYAKMTVSKIILLADPDPDGWHINSLLLALYYKFMPEAFARGMIYVARTPEFYAIHGGNLYLDNGAQALRKKLAAAKVPKTAVVNHIKGWGEINPVLMRILAMDASTRTLIQIESLTDADEKFRKLMADDTEERKQLMGVQ